MSAEHLKSNGVISIYFVIEWCNKTMCINCNEAISVRKECSIKCHFETKHSQNYAKFTESLQWDKYESLKHELKPWQLLKETPPCASFYMAHSTAKHGKPCIDGELIKNCMISAAVEIWPEKDLMHLM